MSESASERFLDEYKNRWTQWGDKATLLEEALSESLTDKNYDIHIIAARAKTASSLDGKIRRKNYSDPQNQITDLLGARIITYYGEQVDNIVQRLRRLMVVDEKNSLDKRSILEKEENFGYRSVHLVGKFTTEVARANSPLHNQIFEVQIRSVLDHAWAEIEHEVVYKAGVKYPPAIRRRFAAVAGTFEILEREFLQLREASAELIDGYVAEYKRGQSLSAAFDSARMCAAMEFCLPEGRGWRDIARDHEVNVVSANQARLALEAANYFKAIDISNALEDVNVIQLLDALAAESGCAAQELSHVSVCAVLVGYKDLELLKRYLPDIASSTGIQRIFPGLFMEAGGLQQPLQVDEGHSGAHE